MINAKKADTFQVPARIISKGDCFFCRLLAIPTQSMLHDCYRLLDLGQGLVLYGCIGENEDILIQPVIFGHRQEQTPINASFFHYIAAIHP